VGQLDAWFGRLDRTRLRDPDPDRRSPDGYVSSSIDFDHRATLHSRDTCPCSFVSLYQAGEGIYKQFDKVLVIDEGRQVYFGPANEARQYMMSLGYADLPRQTTADYLTGCTDPNERKFAEGRTTNDVPAGAVALEAAYKQSETYARMMAERDEFKAHIEQDTAALNEFRQAVAEEKRRGAGKKSPYTASFASQVWALMVRQFQLKAQDRTDMIVSWTTSVIIALLVGSCYFLLPETAAGAFTRGGLIFTVRGLSGCVDPQRDLTDLLSAPQALLFNSFQVRLP
jgi:ATP-binding cassette subfamily G (WHITE) protein 2 (SNQ2)